MNNKGILTAILAILTMIFLSGCYFGGLIIGNGIITKDERQIKGFDSIVLDGAASINVYTAEDFKVFVTTDSNILDIILTTVRDNTLFISERNNSSLNTSNLRIDIYLPELQSIELNGAGNIDVYHGEASYLKLKLSGAGNIDAKNYKVEKMDISLSGLGNAKVWVTGVLSGSLSGLGSIRYKGEPIKNVDVSGLGQIKPL